MLSPTQRSAFLARISSKDTAPELAVRRLLHALGYRFRTQYRELPGKPDIAFPKRRKAVFIHGCFWHHHPGCKFAHVPKTRRDYWLAKFEANQRRDARNIADVAALGWEPAVVWECEMAELPNLQERLMRFLGPARWAPD